MAWSAPYRLVPQTEMSANEGVLATNPFTSSQQLANSETQQTNENIDAQAPRRQEVNVDSKNCYVPPGAIFVSTGSGNVDNADTQQSDHSHNEVTSSQEYTAALYKGEESAHSIYQPSGLPSDHHPVKERPQSLLTNTGRKPQKGILKTQNDRSSITPCAVPTSRSPKLTTGSVDSCSTGREIDMDSSDEECSNTVVGTLSQKSKHLPDDDKQHLIELEERLDSIGYSSLQGKTSGNVGRGQSPHPHKRLQKLRSELNLDALAQNELELKANLFYHIGNPIKRWRVEKVVPGKLVLQLLKTFCLVVQVVLYTNTFPRQRAEFFYESREVFENLFFMNYSQDNPRDLYSAFNAEDILAQFDYIVNRYCQLPNITIGGYDFAYDEHNRTIPAIMTLRQYATAHFDPRTDSYELNGTIEKTSFDVTCEESASERYNNVSNDRLFNRFVELVISFPIKNMRVIHPEHVECYLFNISIHFNVKDNSGKVIYYLQEEHSRFDCMGKVDTPSGTFSILYGALTVLDVIVLGLCMVSIYLTCDSLQRACKLYKAMGVFYEQQLKITLSWWERKSLFPFWHTINTVSDLLIIAGSIAKIFLDFFVFDDSAPVRVLLGTAVLCQAIVMLRYISYFKQLNALTRTMYLAFPELLKFLLCSALLFLAFAMTGWIILGPFHKKFDTMNSAIETLFGLLNGDDIYNTFTQIREQDDITAYVYSRIFLYVFLALFMYAVLNLFTSLIITAYEASQNWDTATRNEVRRFVFSGPLTPNGVALRDYSLTKKYVDPKLIKERNRTSLRKRLSLPLRSRADTLLGK